MVILQFSNKRNMFSWAIRFFTWSWTAHVDVVESDGNLIGSTFRQGVHRDIFKRENYDRIHYYTIDIDYDDFMYFIKSQLGKKYDWFAFLGFLFRRDWHNTDRWFCFELIAWAAEKSGKPLLNSNKHNRITGRELLLSPFVSELNVDQEEIVDNFNPYDKIKPQGKVFEAMP